ncbi:MAG TPA: 1-deoxy-D-xylulose-5-phosphate reductoisomerase [Acidimicrobiia bacterium]
MTVSIIVLGSTGSIGTQTLEVADNLGLEVTVLAARHPGETLLAQARRFPDAQIVVATGSSDERKHFESQLGRRVEFGDDAVAAAASHHGSVVVNGIVGAAGLAATLAALGAGNRVGLANKESLVAGGPVVKAALLDGIGEIIPVDSEHSAIYQCLVGESIGDVSRLMLTASGGPFRGMTPEQLEGVTPAEALRHPTWEMGRRVTIDSATLFNKGLEVIEAHYLFGLDYDRIDVVIHPQSIVHSMVEFVDGSWKGHLGQADMRIPIQYALTAPQRSVGIAARFQFPGVTLAFEEPDRNTFPALDLAFEAGRQGGSSPAVMNAADEVAVEAFLEGRLGFPGIAELVARTLEGVEWRDLTSLEDVIAVDAEARVLAGSLISAV